MFKKKECNRTGFCDVIFSADNKNVRNSNISIVVRKINIVGFFYLSQSQDGLVFLLT